jgi:hypothetical protein
LSLYLSHAGCSDGFFNSLSQHGKIGLAYRATLASFSDAVGDFVAAKRLSGSTAFYNGKT